MILWMKYKVDLKTKKYTDFLTDLAVILKKHNVKDLVVVANINGQIRNTYLPVTGVEDPLYCHISDAVNYWLKDSGIGKPDKTSKSINNGNSL